MHNKMLKIIVPILVVAVFMVSTFSAVTVSGTSTDGGDSPAVSNQQEQQDQRQVQFQFDNSTDQVQIQSDTNLNGTSSNIGAEISFDEGLDVSFSYSGNLNQIQSNLEIELKATKIVEFINSNTAIPGYDQNDTLLNTFYLKNATWTFSASNSTVGTVTTWSVNATATLSNSAQVQFKFLLTNDYALQANGNTLAPNSLKWSVVISNYPYASAQSQLALQVALQSGNDRSGFQSDYYTNTTEDVRDGLVHNPESAVNFGNSTATGFFSWSDSYTADGVNKSIVTSPSLSVDQQDNNTNLMYFSFVQGKIINWDPKIGVSLATSSPYIVQHPNALTSSQPTSQTSSQPASQSVSQLISQPTSQPVSQSSANKAKSTPGFEAVALLLSVGVMAVLINKKRKN